MTSQAPFGASIKEVRPTVRFLAQPVTKISRPLHQHEYAALYDFERHAFICELCCHFLESLNHERATLCSTGKHQARAVRSYMYREMNQIYSTSEGYWPRTRLESVPNFRLAYAYLKEVELVSSKEMNHRRREGRAPVWHGMDRYEVSYWSRDISSRRDHRPRKTVWETATYVRQWFQSL